MDSRLTCREFVASLADQLEERLPAGRRLRQRQHAMGCPACAAYARSYRGTVRLARAAFEPPAAAAPEDLVRAILSARDAGA